MKTSLYWGHRVLINKVITVEIKEVVIIEINRVQSCLTVRLISLEEGEFTNLSPI